MLFFMPVALAVTIGALYLYFTRNFDYWKKRTIPGPKPVPLFGNIKNSALRYGHASVVLKEIYEKYPAEKVVGIYRMTTPCLMIRDLDIVRHVTIKDFDYFTDRGFGFSKEGLGKNLIHADGDTWRQLRRHFSPMFTNQKLKNMIHILQEGSDKYVNYISDKSTKTPEHDIFGLMKNYTLSTMMACVFGLDFDPFSEDLDYLMKIGDTIFATNFNLEIDIMYPGLLTKLNIPLFPKYLTEFFEDLVKTVTTQKNGMSSPRRDFMDIMLEIKTKHLEAVKRCNDDDTKTLELTDSIIAAQAIITFTAGFENASSVMGYMLYHLTMDPSIQDRLTDEIDRYLQRHDDQIELETLHELTYFEQVLNETLRMYPTAGALLRMAVRDYDVPGTNIKLAKGQRLLVPVLAIHHDETYYPEPEKFNPERFAPENVADRHSCAFLPFGIGPRRCIGVRFVLLQTRLWLIRLLSKFRLEASKNTPRCTSFNPYRLSLFPLQTIYVNLYPRE